MSTLIAIDEEKINSLEEKLNHLINLFVGGQHQITNNEIPTSFSITQSADYLAVSPQFIRDRIKDGSLSADRVGSRIIRIKRTELDKLKSDI